MVIPNIINIFSSAKYKNKGVTVTMKNKKNELILSAINLVRVGEALEEAKGKLKQLVDQGVPYESEEMKKALEECLLLQQEWKVLEAEHVRLKNRITRN